MLYLRSARVAEAARRICFPPLERAARLPTESHGLEESGFFGNGGSAADARHLAAELTVRFVMNRRALARLALTPDRCVLTACGNERGTPWRQHSGSALRPDSVWRTPSRWPASPRGWLVGKADTATLTQAELMRELKSTEVFSSEEKTMELSEARRRIQLRRKMGLSVGFASGHFSVATAAGVDLVILCEGAGIAGLIEELRPDIVIDPID